MGPTQLHIQWVPGPSWGKAAGWWPLLPTPIQRRGQRKSRPIHLLPILVFVVCSRVKFNDMFRPLMWLGECKITNTRVGTLIVATIYLQLIQNRYMFRSYTVLQCSHQHCVQPVASDVEVVGYLYQRLLC